jgi:hypothetical protein
VAGQLSPSRCELITALSLQSITGVKVMLLVSAAGVPSCGVAKDDNLMLRLFKDDYDRNIE